MDPGELVFYLESLQVLIDLFFFFPFSSNLVLSFSLLRLLLTDKWFLLKKKKKKGSFLFLGPESMPANGKMGIVKKKKLDTNFGSKGKNLEYKLLFSWIKMFYLDLFF